MAETNIKDVKLKIGTETQFQSKLKDLPINTLVGTTDPIQEGELDTSIITKLNKAENALPKPTNDTTGSAGQVLKKTANGSEWGDAPSGGGKLYRHDVTMFNTSSGYLHCTIINNTNTEFTASDLNDSFFKKVISASADVISMHKTYMVKLITVTSTGISAIYYASYPFSDTASLSFSQNDSFTDTVTEL